MLENLDSKKIAEWFAKKHEAHAPFIYSSVDVRHAGFKTAPVDTNIFPAGFNLLSEEAKKLATEQAKEFFEHNCKGTKTLGLIAENFSRNDFYWANINSLKEIFTAAGKEVLLGVTEEGIDYAQAVRKDGDKLYFDEEAPCMIIANRDFSGGAPEELQGISQPVFPPLNMGWYRRKKSEHFAAYAKVTEEFAKEFDFDPWLITPYFAECEDVDFKARTGLDRLEAKVNEVLEKTRAKYAEHGIDQEPYVFIKADSGTFGMGIMTVKSGAEVHELNKKARNKMTSIKEGVQNTSLIIQEGIPSVDIVDSHPAEPVIYFVNGKIIGCFMRYNDERDNLSNLNSRGMKFDNCDGKVSDKPCITSSAGIVSSLAVLAAMHEREDLK